MNYFTSLQFIDYCQENENVRQLAVIGNPIHHTRSPDIHNYLYKHFGIKASYHAVLAEDKSAFIDLIRRTESMDHVTGFNVTLPYKEIAYQIVNTQNGPIQSANTLIKKNQNWLADNTDWKGFAKLLSDDKIDRVLLLGWGGSSIGILHVIRQLNPGADVQVYTRRPNIKIANVKTSSGNYERYSGGTEPVDMIINTTPLGMEAFPENFTQDFLQSLPQAQTYVDINYIPAKTQFLDYFESRGYKVKNGLKMLIYQAFYAHELWFGSITDFELHAEKVQKQLEGII